MTTPVHLNLERSAPCANASPLTVETAREMLARLDLILIKPTTILDLGCGNTALLRQRYPAANIIHSDSLPQSSSTAIFSVDLIVANLLLPWCANIEENLRYWQQILRPGGLLLLTSLGPDTLRELADTQRVVPHFLDMHHVGDALIQAGFRDPVLEVDYLTFTYRDHDRLMHELQAAGMISEEVNLLQLQPNSTGMFSMTHEIIYGHAWGASSQAADEFGEVRIPLSHILRRKKAL